MKMFKVLSDGGAVISNFRVFVVVVVLPKDWSGQAMNRKMRLLFNMKEEGEG